MLADSSTHRSGTDDLAQQAVRPVRRENDHWELKIEGPKGFERSYTLIGGAGQHQPDAIRHLLLKLLPSSA